MHEALFYEKKEPGVRCCLCPQYCRLKRGETGLCGVRREADGLLYTLNYGVCAAMAMDPVEKKPLYHFFPGREIFSLGTYGCNLSCGFCQNWHLAGRAPDPNQDSVRLSSPEIAGMLEKQAARQPLGIAYTYSEPGMWYEFVMDTAREVRRRGYKNVLVTNGYLNEEPLKELLPLIDAMNIDVKSFRDDYYRDHCGGRLSPVLRYVEAAVEYTHVELTYLVVATLNDSDEDMRRFTRWVASLDPAIPVHLSRYFPQHQFTLPPTPLPVMGRLREVAREKLHYVYLGNVPGSDAAHTLCPSCGKPQILREGYYVRSLLKDGACPYCGAKAQVIG